MKLTKTEMKRKDQIANVLSELFQELDNLTSEEKVDLEKVSIILATYNVQLDMARGFCSEIVEKIGEFIESKSESWQEGDNCAAHEDWKASYEDVEFEDVSLDDLKYGEGYSITDLENMGEVLDALMEGPEL